MKLKLPQPYFFMLFSAFLVLCHFIGYYICNHSDYCAMVGTHFNTLGMFGFFIIPLGALYQLGMAAVQNLKGNPVFKHNALSGLACFILLIFLIGMAIKLNPPDEQNTTASHSSTRAIF